MTEKWDACAGVQLRTPNPPRGAPGLKCYESARLCFSARPSARHFDRGTSGEISRGTRDFLTCFCERYFQKGRSLEMTELRE